MKMAKRKEKIKTTTKKRINKQTNKLCSKYRYMRLTFVVFYDTFGEIREEEKEEEVEGSRKRWQNEKIPDCHQT